MNVTHLNLKCLVVKVSLFFSVIALGLFFSLGQFAYAAENNLINTTESTVAIQTLINGASDVITANGMNYDDYHYFVVTNSVAPYYPDWTTEMKVMMIYIIPKNDFTVNHTNSGDYLCVNFSTGYQLYGYINFNSVVGDVVLNDKLYTAPVTSFILGRTNGKETWCHGNTYTSRFRVNTSTIDTGLYTPYSTSGDDGSNESDGIIFPSKPNIDDYPNTVGGYIQYVLDLVFYYVLLPFKLVANFINTIITTIGEFLISTSEVGDLISSLFSSFPEWLVTPIKLVFSISVLMVIVGLIRR